MWTLTKYNLVTSNCFDLNYKGSNQFVIELIGITNDRSKY